MSYMFLNATAFTQTINTWDIRNVSNFTGFMLGKTSHDYSSSQYDNILNSWSLLPVQNNLDPVDFGCLIATTSGFAGRVTLTSTDNWNIIDCSLDNAFTSIWRTTGYSESIIFPTSDIGGTYNFYVDWGDGSSEFITSSPTTGITHTYATPNDYTVKVVGTIIGFSFGDAVDINRLKLREITKWGPLNLGNNGYYFNGCNNLVLTGITDTLDLTGTNNLTQMFLGCGSLTTINNINGWDFSNVVNMSGMFGKGCDNFNQTLNFNTGPSLANTSGMFAGATNFNSPITLYTNNVTDMKGMFSGCYQFNQPITFNTSSVQDMSFMFYGATGFNQHVSGFTTDNVITTRGMFANATLFNKPIGNWFRSRNTVIEDMSYMFAYATSFSYDITQWNTDTVTDMSHMFEGATSFDYPLGAWHVYNVQDMSYMFANNGFFTNRNNNNINNWVTYSVTTMKGMFQNATHFNQPIDNWVMTSVLDTSYMFAGATNFNQDLKNWERVGSTMASVRNMTGMFANAISFNPFINISITYPWWNAINVLNTTAMFSGATLFDAKIKYMLGEPLSISGTSYMFANATSFTDGYISEGDTFSVITSAVTNMSYMFYSATSFNMVMSGTNTSNVVNMSNMFNHATSFKQDLNNWNVSKVTDMSYMFNDASNFYSDLNNWDVSKVINMSHMFNDATIFNGRVDSWIITGVTNMSYMFANARLFNRDINNWSPINVTNMSYMFANANSFNYRIDTWNISNVNNFVGFMSGKTYNDYNSTYLSGLYNSWSLLSVHPNLTIDFGTIKYTSGGSAGRATLTGSPNNWIINDGGI